MAQFADIVRQVERLKAEKARIHKFRREKVAYVDTNESDQEFDIAYEDVEDGEVNFAELKPGLPYTCKLLRPSDGRKLMSKTASVRFCRSSKKRVSFQQGVV